MKHFQGFRLYQLALLIGSLFFLSIVTTTTVSAAQVRGRIDGFDPYRNMVMPARGILIILYQRHNNGNWVPVAQSMSDNGGFYYFYNLGYGYYKVGPTLYNAQSLQVHNNNLHAGWDIPALRLR